MVSIYRVTRANRPLFDGTGAARFGARWNSPGQPAICAAGSYAGALLEVLVHAQRLDLKVPYHCLVIHIPAAVRVMEPDAASFFGWDAADYVASRRYGDHWLREGRTAVLCVPSMTGRPHERNYLINPHHADVRKLKFDKPHAVLWDDRLTASR